MIYRYQVPFAVMDVKQSSSIGFLRGRAKEWLPLSHLASGPLRFGDMNIEEITRAARPIPHAPLYTRHSSTDKNAFAPSDHLYQRRRACPPHPDNAVCNCVPPEAEPLGLLPLHYLIERQRKVRPISLQRVPRVHCRSILRSLPTSTNSTPPTHSPYLPPPPPPAPFLLSTPPQTPPPKKHKKSESMSEGVLERSSHILSCSQINMDSKGGRLVWGMFPAY